MEFTGERVIPGHLGTLGLYHVHQARYEFAQTWSHGRSVLDVACGTGYGSEQLSLGADSVTGLDIDHNSVDYARWYCAQRPNCEFAVGDALSLPFPNSRFDLVVSFETIEHVRTPEIFVAEVQRVLRSGGNFIVSTPCRSMLSAFRLHREHINEFHQKEFSRLEFVALLKNSFLQVTLYTQRFTNPAYYRSRNYHFLALLSRRLLPFTAGLEISSRFARKATRTYNWMQDATCSDLSISQKSGGSYLIAVCTAM